MILAWISYYKLMVAECGFSNYVIPSVIIGWSFSVKFPFLPIFLEYFSMVYNGLSPFFFLKPPNRTIRAWLSDFSCIYTHNHHAEKRHRHSQLHQRNTEKAGRFKTTIISEIITFLFSWKDRAAWRTPSSCKSQKMTGESTVQAAEIQKQSENLQAGFNFRKYINVISTGGA